MTENEALKSIVEDGIELGAGDYVEFEALKVAAKALEEIQKYRAIGTVEECREATEKQRRLEIEEFGICPLCYYDFGYEKANYCPNCGHALALEGGE